MSIQYRFIGMLSSTFSVYFCKYIEEDMGKLCQKMFWTWILSFVSKGYALRLWLNWILIKVGHSSKCSLFAIFVTYHQCYPKNFQNFHNINIFIIFSYTLQNPNNSKEKIMNLLTFIIFYHHFFSSFVCIHYYIFVVLSLIYYRIKILLNFEYLCRLVFITRCEK